MAPASRYRFGDFEADVRSGELWKQGELVRLQDLPFRLLAALLDHPGELVTRAQLGERLWGTATFVDFEAGLNTAVAKLREALGDDAEVPRFIETVPKRGYRFVGVVGDASQVVRNSTDVAATNRRGTLLLAIALVATMAALAIAAWRWSVPSTVRIAVALFDNETDQPELDRLAQVLTDSTVVRLTADPRLAVIGNAAVLRTDRPFRDLVKIRDTLSADYIVLGQIQKKGDTLRVLAHLIRGTDQAHVWVQPTPLLVGAESDAEAQVVAAVAGAVSAEITKDPGPA